MNLLSTLKRAIPPVNAGSKLLVAVVPNVLPARVLNQPFVSASCIFANVAAPVVAAVVTAKSSIFDTSAVPVNNPLLVVSASNMLYRSSRPISLSKIP